MSAVSDLEVESEGGRQLGISPTRSPAAGASWWSRPPAPRPCSATSPSWCTPRTSAIPHLIGQYVKLPLCEREIPVIADEYVDREFGTGVVKVTPRMTPTTTRSASGTSLPLIGVLTLDARINDHGPEAYRGLDRFDAQGGSRRPRSRRPAGRGQRNTN